MSNEETVKYIPRGMSFGTLLFLIFMTLKLTGNIAWSWWIVTMPLWIGWVIFTAVLTLALLGLIIHSVYEVTKTLISKN